jgi:hypothetical protein
MCKEPDQATVGRIFREESGRTVATLIRVFGDALSAEAQVALTLRLLGGLSTTEVARSFLIAEPTMAQRLVRAKRQLRRPQRGPPATSSWGRRWVLWDRPAHQTPFTQPQVVVAATGAMAPHEESVFTRARSPLPVGSTVQVKSRGR